MRAAEEQGLSADSAHEAIQEIGDRLKTVASRAATRASDEATRMTGGETSTGAKNDTT